MIKIETYFLLGDEFFPVENFQGSLPDPEHVSGAIQLEINRRMILTLEMWDDINYLWPYIVNGLEEITTKDSWTTYFPDQPVELSFRTDASRRRVEVEVHVPRGQAVGAASGERASASADYEEFMTTMCEAGEKFFRRMAELLPDERASYERELRRLEKLMLQHR